MKRLLILISLVAFIPLYSSLTYGATKQISETDHKLTDLSNRLTSIEATWGRFQLGGNFSLMPFTNINTGLPKPPVIEYNQAINLFMDAFVDQHLQFSMKLSNQRGWGALTQYVGSTNLNPLQIDEAYLKMQYPESFNYLGRFRFTMGSLGIISDFYVNPIEGIAIQQAFNKFHVIALYNRINTLYNPTTNQAESSEDYLAGRIGWSNNSNIIGINIVPNGIGPEHSFSLDWSQSTSNYKIALELGWYSFNSNEYPELNASLAPGMLLSYGRRISSTNFWQLKAGYFASNFRPSLSSLGHCSGDDREWFLPNSKGIEFYWDRQFTKNYQFENRLLLLLPVEVTPDPTLHYRLHMVLTKIISPINQLQFGTDLKFFNNSINTQVFAGWTLRF